MTDYFKAPIALPAIGPAADQIYRQVAAIGGSDLRTLLISPSHWRSGKDRSPSDAMKLGTLVHAAVLEPDEVERRYRVQQTMRRDVCVERNTEGKGWCVSIDGRATGDVYPTKTAATAACGSWSIDGETWHKTRAEAEASDVDDGREAISSAMFSQAERMRLAVLDNTEASALLDGATVEEAMIWRDDSTRLICRGKADAVSRTQDGWVMIDLKTVGRAGKISPENAARWVIDARYDAQLAHYAAGFEACTKRQITSAAIIAVESCPPHGCTVLRLSSAFLALGRHHRAEALRRAKIALDGGRWGYPEAVEVEPPAWALPNEVKQHVEAVAFRGWPVGE